MCVSEEPSSSICQPPIVGVFWVVGGILPAWIPCVIVRSIRIERSKHSIQTSVSKSVSDSLLLSRNTFVHTLYIPSVLLFSNVIFL